MTRSIEGRLDRLDRPGGDRPFIAVYQDLDDRDLYHVGSRDSDLVMTMDQVDTRYQGWTVFMVIYEDNWRSRDG